MNNIVDDIARVAGDNCIWVAFSGGVDSHVLLHLLATAKQNVTLKAIHIDHGLQINSAEWVSHCESVSGQLNVMFTAIKVDVTDQEDKGTEAAARIARYAGIRNIIKAGDLVLTAQHQEDQAETLLLQLLRGAGPKGLSSMPRISAFGAGQLMRPLLDVPKEAILAYAQQHQLKWIDDPSNADTRWDRNYLRHELWPKLTQRWPTAAKVLARSATHCAEASDLLNTLAEQDIAALGRDKQSLSLPVPGLLALPLNQCRNVLRHWCQWQRLPLPSTAQLQKIIEEVCSASEDAMPLVQWQGVDVRRYQNELYMMAALLEQNKQGAVLLPNLEPVLLHSHQQLVWQQVQGAGLSASKFNSAWRLAYRQGGEKIQLLGRTHHSQLKHLMQEWQIPPWLRDRVPLIFDGEKLIAVVGHAVAEGYAALDDELGLNPVIENKATPADFD